MVIPSLGVNDEDGKGNRLMAYVFSPLEEDVYVTWYEIN